MMKKLFLGLIAFFLSVSVGLADQMLEKKSRHFIVSYHDSIPEEFAKQTIDYAERYYDDITQRLGFRRFHYWTWDDRAQIIIYADQDTFIKKTKQPKWSAGAASYDEKMIWTYPRDSGFFDTLLPHELGHIIFREVVGFQHLPRWLEEGVASYLEVAKRLGADKLVLDARDNDSFIPLEELGKVAVHNLNQSTEVSLFYAESVSIIGYVIQKFGIRNFNRFCERLRQGKSLDQAVKYAFFGLKDLSGLSRSWERYLEGKRQ